MENNESLVPDNQFLINIDDKQALVTLVCDDENEKLRFDITSEDDLSEEQIERVKVTVEKMLLDFIFSMEQKAKEEAEKEMKEENPQ